MTTKDDPIAVALAEALLECLEMGFQLPVHAVVVGTDGSIIAMRYTDDSPSYGLGARVLAEHHEGGVMGAPVNIVFTDSRGEAARLVIETDGEIGEIGEIKVLS